VGEITMKKLDELGTLSLGTDKFYEEIVKTNFNDRKIILNDEVNSSILEDVGLWILKWNKEDKDIPTEKRKKIYLYINSPGGDVLSGLNLCDIMKVSKTPIVTICFSYGYSMGCVIFVSGHERIMFPSSSLLIHDGSMSLSGSNNKVKDLQKFYAKLDDFIKNAIVGNSNISASEYDENIDRELYILADDCKEKGLCDKIIGIDCDLDYIL
jgi:ATP-dependent Clp protease protease subunit